MAVHGFSISEPSPFSIPDSILNREMESSKVKSKTKGKRKMEEDTRSYITWNLEMERILADVLRDQRSLGYHGDGAWKVVAYNTAAQVLSTRFKVQLTGDNVKNRIKVWQICHMKKPSDSDLGALPIGMTL